MRSSRFSRIVARRYLWSRRSEAFISIITITSVLGVAIGVMVLNIVMAIMSGFEIELREKVVGTNSHVVVRRFAGPISHWKEVQKLIEATKGVSSVSAFTYHQVLLRNEDRTSGLLIRGLEQGSAAARQLESSLENGQSLAAMFHPTAISQERTESADENEIILPGIVVGRELAISSGLILGSTVSLLAPSVTSSPFGLMPRYKRFVVSGIYSTGLTEYENSLAYVALPAAQSFFRSGDTISGYEVRVDKIDQAPLVAKRISEQLPGFTASDWTEQNKPLWDALRMEKTVYFIVLLLIIVMASFSIITTLVMLVLEKRKDIAIMKAMGATRREIGNIFRIQGAIIGGIGTLIGVALGYLGCLVLREYGFPLDPKVFPFSTLPVRIELLNFVIVGLSAFVICCLATIYPAWRASGLDPSDVLRYE